MKELITTLHIVLIMVAVIGAMTGRLTPDEFILFAIYAGAVLLGTYLVAKHYSYENSNNDGKS